MTKYLLRFVAVAFLLISLQDAKAQFIVNPDLPVPTPKPATSVDKYSYQANWEALSGVDGFTVFNYLVNRATEDGQKLYLFNSDFSWVESDGTIEQPDDNGTTSSGWVIERFNNINRMGWQIGQPVYANGVLGLNNAWAGLTLYGFMVSPAFDFSLGDGKVYVEFTVCGQEGADSISVSLIKYNSIVGGVADKKEIKVTPEWTHHCITLEGGAEDYYIQIKCEDLGNGEDPIYFFFDDLSIYQYFNKGEEAVIPYSYTHCQNPNGTSLEIETDPDEIGQYAYRVASYVAGKVSPSSDMVYVNGDADAITRLSQLKASVNVSNERIDIANPECKEVSIYDTLGHSVFTDNTGRSYLSTTMQGKGIYIVRVGSETFKVVCGR